MNVSHVLPYFQSFAYPISNPLWFISVFSSAPDPRKESSLLCYVHGDTVDYIPNNLTQNDTEHELIRVKGRRTRLVPEEVL